jgi:hypothetical protein
VSGLVAEVSHSVFGRGIRLTDERWTHITDGHREMADQRRAVLDVLAAPAEIREGNSGELLAIGEEADGKRLIVVYREGDQDGYVITAFLTSRRRSYANRRILWQRPPQPNTSS